MPAEERKQRLGLAWRDVIRIRVGLAPRSGEVPIQGWDETPLWWDETPLREDALDAEATAVAPGSEIVAVNASHATTCNKNTVMLLSTSMNGYKAAFPVVVFKVPSIAHGDTLTTSFTNGHVLNGVGSVFFRHHCRAGVSICRNEVLLLQVRSLFQGIVQLFS